MERISDASEKNIATTVECLGATTVSSLAERIITGADISGSLPDVASRLGMEPAKAQAAIHQAVSEFRARLRRSPAPLASRTSMNS